MRDLLERYNQLLEEVDRWFAACQAEHPGLISCGHGCSACCRGLFDITILDALYLKQGFDLLPVDEQEGVLRKSTDRLSLLSSLYPEFVSPWILNRIPEEQWETMMPEEDDTPCVLLSEDGACLVYAHRPMTCRLNGIPLVDVSGEGFFDDWCTLNFAGVDPMGIENIRHPFNDLFRQELLLFRELTKRLLETQVSELDTIIPAAVFLGEDALRAIRLSNLPIN
jgi:Fe-S-cluster containining protein